MSSTPRVIMARMEVFTHTLALGQWEVLEEEGEDRVEAVLEEEGEIFYYLTCYDSYFIFIHQSFLWLCTKTTNYHRDDI